MGQSRLDADLILI